MKNALAAFYLKSAAKAENSVEFFHKSFGEFLCAKRMVESLEDLTEKTGKRRKTYVVSDEEFEWRVYDLFGYGSLTVEVVEYLMALLVKSQVELVVLFERFHGFYLDWCDGKFIEGTEETVPQKKAGQLQQWGIESGQRRVNIYTGLNVMILLFELHRYGRSQEGLRELHFYPCGQYGNEEFDETLLLRIIGYSQCLGDGAFMKIVGNFPISADLSGTNFRRADLSGADLSGANLKCTDLSGADLSGANLSSADLSGANLKGANLRGASLIHANLIHANLIRVDLSDANLIHANLIRVDLSDANLIHANLSSADLSGANLSSADLSGANLSSADLSSADLSSADLNGANLIRVNLSDAKLIRVNLNGANLSGAKLIRVNLNGANLSGANLRSADLRNADLSGANLNGADLSNIKCNNNTQWSNTISLHEAIGSLEDLQQNPELAAAVAQSQAASL